jgi:formylglycine-generating enzyme required for sulfatase activity
MRRATVLLSASLLLVFASHCSSKSSPATSTGDGATADAGAASGAPSCEKGGAGQAGCGPSKESCCASPRVAGGEFHRSYDGVSTNGASKAFPATISDVALDRFEVTVGRFRPFVEAVTTQGWHPAAGAGKHSHLHGGGIDDGAEPGWDASWNAELATSAKDWSTNLACTPKTATWTGSAGAGDDHPVNCVDWYEAYAFCIWDGGFLPSEAEWNYAAAGGAEQRAYPWSAAYPPGSATLDCQLANYSSSWPSKACVSSGADAVGADSPAGDARWGQADMAGNVFEWTLDYYASTYAASCDDCADFTKTSYRVIRGGSFDGSPACLLASLRESSAPDGRSDGVGVRCARPPQ